MAKNTIVSLRSRLIALMVAILAIGGFWAASAVDSPPDIAPGDPAVVYATGDLGGSVNEIKPVADLIKADSTLDRALLLGDICYPDGTPDCYPKYVDPNYGSIKGKVIAAPGNHDYHTSGGAGFFGYYPDPIPKAFDVGNNWVVITVNTEIDHGSSSTQRQAIKNLLAANAGKHIIAITHHPRYTAGSGHGDETALDAIVGDMDAAGVDLFLAGHNHTYERFQPMGSGGSLRAEGQGIRFFTVGTGGNGLYSCKTHSGLQYCDGSNQGNHHGALKLELYNDHYNWAFKTTNGLSLDAGTAPTRNGGSTTTTSSSTSTSTSTSSSTSTSTSTSTTTTTTKPGTTVPIRAAFYYPWFPETWSVSGSHVFYNPSLGYYDSSNAGVVDAHIRALEYGQFDVGIASWWGQNTHSENTRIPLLLDRTNALNSPLRWALYYEKEGTANPSVAELQNDLAYINLYYASQPTYERVNGKPVLFVYNANDTSCSIVDKWKQANAGYGFYLNLKVFSGYTKCANKPDSWHQYAPGVSADSQAPYSYSISPGFWKANEATPRLARDNVRWTKNIADMKSSNAQWQLVTTFNEWGEGSAVENASEWASDSGNGVYLDALAGFVPPTKCSKLYKSYSGNVGPTRDTIPSGQYIDGSMDVTVAPSQYLNTFGGGKGSCWIGGVAWDSDSWLTTPWETFHHSGAWNLKGGADSVTIKDSIAINFGDSFRVEENSPNFTLDGVLGLFGHDDCIENDNNQSGTVKDSICTSFVIYSSQGGTVDGSNNTVTLKNNFLELLPTPTVYKGPDTPDNKYPAPGTGGFWKLDDKSPKLVLRDNVFVASVIPNHQDLKPPATLSVCSGNIVIWKGSGAFPEKAAWLNKCPDTIIK